MPFAIDLRQTPIVLVHESGSLRDDELRGMLDSIAQELRRSEAQSQVRVGVLDLSERGPPQAKHRQLRADWLREHTPLLRRTVLGVAFVLPSPLLRGALTAITWLTPLPVAHHTVEGTLGEALVWARRLLFQSGRPA